MGVDTWGDLMGKKDIETPNDTTKSMSRKKQCNNQQQKDENKTTMTMEWNKNDNQPIQNCISPVQF